MGFSTIRTCPLSHLESPMNRPTARSLTPLRLALIIAIAALSATPGHAQGRALGSATGGHLIRIGVGGGATLPTKQAGDVFKRGVNGQAFLLISPPGIPPLRLNLGYQKFDLKEAFLAGATTGESQMLSGVAGTSIDLFRLGPIRPYVTAGVGAFNLTDKLMSDTGSTSVSSLKFGIDGGAGLALKIGRLEAFVEGRVQNVYTSEKGMIDRKTIQSIPLSFGLIF